MIRQGKMINLTASWRTDCGGMWGEPHQSRQEMMVARRLVTAVDGEK